MKKRFTPAVVWICVIWVLMAQLLLAQRQQIRLSGAVQGGGTGNDGGQTTVVDRLGNIYVAGSFEGNATFETNTLTTDGRKDGFVAKYNNLGALQWTIQIGGLQDDLPTSLALDRVGDVYVAGYSTSPSIDFDGIVVANKRPGTADIFYAKMTAAGGVVWARSGGGVGNDIANAITFDSFNRLYMTGSFSQEADIDTFTVFSQGGIDAFVTRLNPANGNAIWAEQAGGTLDDFGRGITSDQFGNVYVTGGFASPKSIFAFLELDNTDPLGTQDIFIAAYDSVSSPLWVRSAGGPNNDIANAIQYDTLTRTIYLAGSFTNAAVFGPQNLLNTTRLGTAAFVSKLADNGDFIWTRHSNGVLAVANSVLLDTARNVLIGGFYSNVASWDNCTQTQELTAEVNSNQTDAFVAKYTNDVGALVGIVHTGGASKADAINQLGINRARNTIFATGFFSDTIRFSPTFSLTSRGNTDFFLAELAFANSPCGIPTQRPRLIADIEPACLFSDDSLVAGGFTGQIVRWETSIDRRNWVGISNSDRFQPIGALSADSTYFRVVVKNCDCPAIVSDSVLVVQDFPTQGGTTSGSATVCVIANTGTIRLSGQRGRVVRWELSNDNFRTFAQLPVTTTNFVFNNLRRDTWFRALVRNGTCGQEYSTVSFVKVDSCQVCGFAPTFGGVTAVANDTVCVTANTGFVTLSQHIGRVQYWEVSNNNFATVTRLPLRDSVRVPFRNIKASTWFRAYVVNTTCFGEFSTVTRVDVDSCEACGFAPPIGGNIAGPDTVCAFNNRQTLRLNGERGDVQRWEYSFNNFEITLPNFEDTDSLETRNIFQTTWYRAVVKSRGCAEITSAPYLVVVKSCRTCQLPRSLRVLEVNDQYAYLRWDGAFGARSYVVQYRRAGLAEPWTSDTTTRSMLEIRGLTFDTPYEFRVRSLCAADNSPFTSPFAFRTSCSQGGTAVSAGFSQCAGSNEGNVSLVNAIGTVQWWEYSMDNFQTIFPTVEAAQSYTFRNLNRTTSFRAFVKNGNCKAVYSSPTTIEVVDCGTPCAAPTTLIARNVSITQLQLDFDADEDATYEVSYRAKSEVEWITLVEQSIRPVLLSALRPNTEYDIRVRTNCGTVMSDYSPMITVRTLPEVSVCVPPSPLGIRPRITEADVNWPAVPGVAGYQLQYRVIGTPLWFNAEATTNSVRILNLVPGSRYELQIRSVCGRNFSAYGTSQFFNTANIPCPVPTNVVVTTPNAVSAKVSWTVVGHAERYDVRWVRAGRIDTQSTSARVNTATISGLIPGTVYQVSVRASCTGGINTAYSTQITFNTPSLRENGDALVSAGRELSVYPNPNNGDFVLHVNQSDNMQSAEWLDLALMNLAGQQVWNSAWQLSAYAGQQSLAISIPGLAPGVYLLRIQEPGREAQQVKLIIQ
jgi:hypothetical protein